MIHLFAYISDDHILSLCDIHHQSLLFTALLLPSCILFTPFFHYSRNLLLFNLSWLGFSVRLGLDLRALHVALFRQQLQICISHVQIDIIIVARTAVEVTIRCH